MWEYFDKQILAIFHELHAETVLIKWEYLSKWKLVLQWDIYNLEMVFDILIY